MEREPGSNKAKAAKKEDVLYDSLLRLSRRSNQHRYSAIEAAKDKTALAQLTIARICVSDSYDLVRNQAAIVLASHGTPLDKYRVSILLADSEWMVRSSAVEAVPRMFPKSGERILVNLLEDNHYIVRRNAAIALGDLGLPSSVPPLKARLSRENQDQAKAGILWALAALGESLAFPPLVALSLSDAPGVRVVVWGLVDELVTLRRLTDDEFGIVIDYIARARNLEWTTALKEAVDAVEARLYGR